MARYVIIENRQALDEIVTDGDDGQWHESLHVWIWDDARPNERVYAAGDSPAYVPGNRVGSLEAWPARPDEIALLLPEISNEAGGAMKLWHLKARERGGTWHPSHDEAHEFAIRAQTEQEARALAAEQCGEEGRETWLDARKTDCCELETSGPPGVIVRDFYEP